MSTFNNLTLKQEYYRLIAAGDKVSENDVVMMFKIFVLQYWHGHSDPELERQNIDHISFRKFLGFPKRITDETTVWTFKERIAKSGKEEKIWNEIQRHLDFILVEIKREIIQKN